MKKDGLALYLALPGVKDNSASCPIAHDTSILSIHNTRPGPGNLYPIHRLTEDFYFDNIGNYNS
jgi:hypothetical protein